MLIEGERSIFPMLAHKVIQTHVMQYSDASCGGAQGDLSGGLRDCGLKYGKPLVRTASKR